VPYANIAPYIRGIEPRVYLTRTFLDPCPRERKQRDVSASLDRSGEYPLMPGTSPCLPTWADLAVL
jgi:hypothetical protein